MTVRHFINGQSEATPVPVIEWQLIYSESMGGPVLQGRNPGGEWESVLCIDGEGLMDATYSPGLAGLKLTKNGYVNCVESYADDVS